MQDRKIALCPLSVWGRQTTRAWIVLNLLHWLSRAMTKQARLPASLKRQASCKRAILCWKAQNNLAIRHGMTIDAHNTICTSISIVVLTG